MRPDDTQSSTVVRQRLFSAVQSERLQAVADVCKLDPANALTLLREALSHWDRRLVVACASLLAEQFGAHATTDIIKVIDSRPINHGLAIQLLIQCGTSQAALKIWSRRADSRSLVVSLAWEGLGKLKSPEAALAICKSCGSWDSDLEKYLDLLPKRFVVKLFQTLRTQTGTRLLESNDAREYFRRRGLESSIFPRNDDQNWLRKVLDNGVTLEDIGATFLDQLSSDEIRECLESLPQSVYLSLLKDRPTAAYLGQRGVRSAEPAQSQTPSTTVNFEQRDVRFAEPTQGQPPTTTADLEHAASRFVEPAQVEPPTPLVPKETFVSRLSRVTGVDSCQLGILCSLWKHLDDEYERSEIRKRRGGFREILAPSPLLKYVQRAINSQILTKAVLHPACHGFRRKHSIVSNASPHIGQEIVVNIDLKDFFPSICAGRVYGVYKSLEHPADEARFLTRLSTYKEHLPQGAPTSPMLANLVCRRLDSRLSGLARKHGANYTRYADDLTFSGPRRIVDTLPFIRQIIQEEGLTVSEEKVRLTGRGNRQEVTGLVVNQAVAVPRATRRRLRAAFHRLAAGKPITWNHEEIGLTNLQGHVAFVTSVQPDLGEKLRWMLDEFLPDPAPSEPESPGEDDSAATQP